MFSLTFTTNHDAFKDKPHKETQRVFEDIVKRIYDGEDFTKFQRIFDDSGNLIGWCKYSND
jgi:hypothetical protein